MKKGIKLVVAAAVLLAAGSLAAAKSANKRLWDAALSGTAADVRKAIKKGANVNVRDCGGVTPLMQAAWKNTDIDVLKVLLEAGADVNAQTKDGWTALMWAARGNANPDVLKLLLNAGADINARNNNGDTALMCAARDNTTIDVLKVLLYAGTNVNARDNDAFDDKDSGTFDDKILKILSKAQEVVIDYNRDGEINCTDRAVAFKLVWDQAYNPSDCELVRNYNEGVIYNGVVFNHLFVRVRRGFEWVYVEPAYKPGCWKSYKMEDVWGDMYDPLYNYYGETEKWLYKCGGL